MTFLHINSKHLEKLYEINKEETFMSKKALNEKLFNAIAGIVVITVLIVYYWLLSRLNGFPIN